MKNSIASYLGIAATALITNGCTMETGSETCTIKGGEITNIDGPARALEVCQQSKERVLKCIKSIEGTSEGLETHTIQCGSKKTGSQINDAFTQSTYTICQASSNPENIQVECK